MGDHFFLRYFGPGLLNGVSLGQWLKLLSRNRWRVGLPFLGRVAVVTFAATGNTIIGGIERLRFDRVIEHAQVHPPLFVLGVWRSGTTHLLNLLCQDHRFGFLNFFQMMNPHIFLSTEWWFAPIQQCMLPATRLTDNMSLGVRKPFEDEIATMVTCGFSPVYTWIFPENHRHYEKHIDFADVPQDDVECWKRTLLQLVKKLSFKHNKPLVLKSPNHTARIRLLLDVFPDAKFVYIHRHPHSVYLSNMNLLRRLFPLVTVQRFDVEELCLRTIPWYRKLTHTYLEQKHLIPKGRLVEVAFADLERSPIPTLRHIYEKLKLPAFEEVQPAMRSYLESLSGYQKNEYPEIDPETKSLLAREWSRSFEQWGYAPD